MLKINIEDYKENVFTEINNKWGIITAGDKTSGFNGMTVSWGGFGIMWNKPVAYIFVRKSRYTHDILDKSNHITIAFLSDKYHTTVNQMCQSWANAVCCIHALA